MAIVTQAEPASAEIKASAGTKPALLKVRSVSKSFGRTQVLLGVSLDVSDGEFLTILGESGSGKTTLLRLIAGFEQLDAGEIWMEDRRIDSLPAYRRPVNTVFQQYALFPHLTVFENVAYGLRAKRAAKSEISERVNQALAMVKMNDWAQSKPGKISGGQQQRVALARALVNRPRMLLLDEPLSALDASLRRQMQSELKSLQREVGITFLFVTHDQEEALTLSDRIGILRHGVLEQIAAPEEIYRRPASEYVAKFIGQTNILRCRVAAGRAQCGPLIWPHSGREGNAVFSLRPECIVPAERIEPHSGSSIVRFHGQVTGRVFQGPTVMLQVSCGDLALLVRAPAGESITEHQEFAFRISDLVALGGEPA